MTQEEFVRQVEANEGIIQKICRLYGHTKPDRDDLFQEIVVQLWRSVPKFRGQSKFSTWVYRVALNTAISDFRRKRRRPALSEAGLDCLEISSVPGDTISDADKEEQLNALYAAIRHLTEIDKAIVMLYLENKSYEEMEDILGINSNSLRVKMNRIKEKLRQLTKNISYGT